MAHQQQIDFCNSVKARVPEFFSGRLVLDVGSLDINGNNQYLFEDGLYIGVDLMEGRNVDFAAKGHELGLPDCSIDVVISTECFEHDRFYADTINNCIRMLKPGGLFIFSCATTGRPEHGTRRTTPQDAPFIIEIDEWCDYYHNLDENDIRQVLDVDKIFKSYEFSTNMQTCDLYFWGVKNGDLNCRNDYSFKINEAQRITYLRSLLETIGSRDNQVYQSLRDITERDQLIYKLESDLYSRHQYIDELVSKNSDLKNSVIEAGYRLAAYDERFSELKASLAEHSRQVDILRASITERNAAYEEVISSKSWALTEPLRVLFFEIRRLSNYSLGLIRGEGHAVMAWLRRSLVAMKFVLRGDFLGLARKIRTYKRKCELNGLSDVARLEACRWTIMSTEHTRFIANLISRRLQEHGWHASIVFDGPLDFNDDWYIVLCPQMYKNLPSGEKRIVFQLEQSVSSRWFTKSYFSILEGSLAVLEYSRVNISYMAENGIVYPHVHYLPIGALPSYGEAVSEVNDLGDVVFYGDCNSSERRRKMLSVLSESFSVRIISEVFGEDLIAALKGAKVVINIHYYDNALLEMPRIQECLSLGVPVVSEGTLDQNDYPELVGAVSFFDQDSIPGMIAAVRAALERPASKDSILQAVDAGNSRFNFMFDRFLIATGFLPASHAAQVVLPLPNNVGRIALSLPETAGRRKTIENELPNGTIIFDGMRRTPGWVGCGLSYLTLANHALKSKQKSLMIMEDDVLLPDDFEEKIIVIQEFLSSREGQWDIFAGVIAALHPEVEVIAVNNYKGMTFVTLNKMTSMVFNIYSEKALKLLASWSPENMDSVSNTIDRFLEAQSEIRVVVTAPFFVGHREEVDSTLWGFNNKQYSEMIDESYALLCKKIDAYFSQKTTNA